MLEGVSPFLIYFMESNLLKVRIAAIHVFPNLYRFEGEEVDKRSEKQKGLVWSFTAVCCCPGGKPKKVLIPLLECTSPWVAGESDKLLKLLPRCSSTCAHRRSVGVYRKEC